MNQDRSHATYVLAESRLTREGMVQLLSGTSFEVVGQGAQFAELDAYIAEREAPAIVLVDIAGDIAVVESLARLCGRGQAMRVVVLTDAVDPRLMAGCFDAGVNGFLLKDISTEALLASLRLTLVGERVFPSQVIPLILRGATGIAPVRRDMASDTGKLSNRELQILRCLVDGNPNKVIANRLDMPEATIKVHIKNILRKINAQNRTQAAIWALHHGVQTHGEMHLAAR